MRIILTHEQADFDALASLLGAFLIDSTSLPVLPRRMNRNVSAFITLYGAELPFVEARDLPHRPVEAVCLVDTQTMATVRGVGKATKVHVVDHHPLRSEVPTDWIVNTEEIGATTTLFVEQIRNQIGDLSVLHATLLLLGIYEDTGSLTYSRTTARDLQAASYLLLQGANLSIAADFINHPLSPGQQKIYDDLRSRVESHTVNGHTVMIACGDARELEEELSTVAHKLRDLLDPEALFLVVRTRSGVQMIGRSTSDDIDVAEITSHFGGGGHARAAASLIKSQAVDEICQKLILVLPKYVQPAMTVADIMSCGPQVLDPATLAQDAAERMQRYGYEGYPVVKEGRVVGLLTRRSVDRSLSHKLNLPAENLMDAGEVFVHSNDSIEHLQKVMTDSGWGQIPVVSPIGDEIIGIVTRTDLLKILTPRANRTGPPNLADRLEQVLPPVRLALLKEIAETASTQRVALYIVGGFVRDLLLERHSLDFDLVVEGDAIALAAALNQRFGGRVKTHSRFGTAKWLIGEIRQSLSNQLGQAYNALELPDFLDLISARTEFYTYPSALPTVEQGSIKLDLHRRDFTINTLALRLDGGHYGKLYDYWGGLNDLKEKRIRVLHSLSFIDDPTRMLRAVRFEQRFKFQIETRTGELLSQAISLINRISGDRIRHEIDHILDEDERISMFARLDSLGLLKVIHPDFRWDGQVENRLRSLENDPSTFCKGLPFAVVAGISKRELAYILLMIDLPVDVRHAIIRRLKLSLFLMQEVDAAGKLWGDLPGLQNSSPSVISRRLEDVPQLSIIANCLASSDEKICSLLMTYLTHWRKVSPTLNGHDIRIRGLSPGPAYRRILGALKDAWLDGKISTADEELALFEQLINSEKSRG